MRPPINDLLILSHTRQATGDYMMTIMKADRSPGCRRER